MSNRATSIAWALAWIWSASCPAVAFASDVVVCRVGDGTSALSSAAAPVFLERHASDGNLAGTIVLPTVASGSNQPITLGGSATSEGALAVSANGLYLTLAGYAVAAGTASVSTSTSATVNRVVARIDAGGNIDTSTRLTTAFSGASVRGAVSADGTAFWVSGNSASSSDAGAWYLTLGAAGGTQILSNPNNMRVIETFSGQLYATSASMPFTNVFTIGSGLPTTSGQVAASLDGLPTSTASPYAFALLDRDTNVAGVDTLYLGDDRTIASGGGIQKWTFNGVTWTQAAMFTAGQASGVRGLAAEVDGADVVIYATTTEASSNTLVRLVDDGSPSPQAVVIATAPTNTVYRGVAIALDVIFRNGFE